MALQTINIGSAANDRSGTSLRAEVDICNDNFAELYDEGKALHYQIEGTNLKESVIIGKTKTGTI